MTPIETRVAGVIAKTLGHSDFEMTPTITAGEIDGWDSLSHLMIITAIEKEFSIRFKLKELNQLKNVGALVALIDTKLSEK